MNLKAIKKTAVLSYDAQNKDYIYESPLLSMVAGVGDTPEAAWELFIELLDDAFDEYQKGRLKYDKPGRPALGKVRLHTEINPEVKVSLTQLAADIGITQGQVIEFLLAQYRANGTRKNKKSA